MVVKYENNPNFVLSSVLYCKLEKYYSGAMLGPKYGLEGISADLIEKTINRIPMSIVNLNPTCFTANTKQTMKQPMPPIPVMTLNIP